VGAADYEDVFLTRNELRNRQGLYIDKDNYEILQTLVRSVRNRQLSVSGLVDNIVRHHIERYGEDINRIDEENIRKPFKRDLSGGNIVERKRQSLPPMDCSLSYLTLCGIRVCIMETPNSQMAFS
ncbi:hypothetical protein EZS27_043844, partial [termite gut metagenome]